jgi:hypothetical protein
LHGLLTKRKKQTKNPKIVKVTLQTCAPKFLSSVNGGQTEGLDAQTRERGPPSSLAEIYSSFLYIVNFNLSVYVEYRLWLPFTVSRS